MLSIGKLAAGPGAGRYYVDQVARGAEDYYAGEGEAPGQWTGRGAEAIGVRGEVRDEALPRLLEGRHPASGDPLRRQLSSGGVAGFDVTLRAPKSLSVLFGIADADVVHELRASHTAAVDQALGYLERNACAVRRGAGGGVLLAGRGFVAARFDHRTSRAGDPLLHTHVVVANAAQGPDGRWSALDGRLLYRHAKTAGYLYQSALRAQVMERLGLAWEPVVHGVADLSLVPRPVIEHFSQRRAEILEHLARRGEHSARAAQIATLDTRRAKRQDVPFGRLRREWRSRAAEHGLTQVRLARSLARRRRFPPISVDVNRVAIELEGSEGLTRDRSTFTRRDVLQAFAQAANDGADASHIEQLADAFLRRTSIVELEPLANERRFTTRDLLALEQETLDLAVQPRPPVPVAEAPAVEAALAARPTLSPEQRQLVTALARSRRSVDVVRAPAGAGKTFALDAAREAWQASGIPVLGCALSARAACELRDQASIDATTIARLTHGFDRGVTLQPASVLIVDEAGMVGTRDLARLAGAADAADARLVLVGDDRQLPEIQAGGLFAALADRPGTHELREVRRQDEQWDRNALAALREGNVERFAHDYEAHGRIVAAPSAEAARAGLIEDWLAASRRGERAVMIAHRRVDVTDLNARARQRLQALGDVGPDELSVGGRVFAVGDRVVARRNDRRLGVINGDAGTVAAIERGRLSLALDTGRRLELPTTYALAGHLHHGYALTAHLAQGSTVDRAFVLGSDELYREWGYTALSRHRREARFYVSATPAFLNRAPEPLHSGDDAVHSASRMLAASRAERLALDGAGIDRARTAGERALKGARQRLADADARVAAVERSRANLAWYRRAGRRDAELRVDDARRQRQHAAREVDRLARDLAAQPVRTAARLARATDPLARLERPRRREHDLGRER